MAGIYTFKVKESTGNTATTTTTVSKDTDNEVERTTYEPPPLGNARLGGEPLTVQWDASTTPYTFTPKAGITFTRIGNGKLQLTTTNPEDKKWEGIYGIYFKKNDHNTFIGFYNETMSGICTPSGYTLNCYPMCQERFLPKYIYDEEISVILHQRSFAPWKRFGNFFFEIAAESFEGDNRGFSLLPSTIEMDDRIGFSTARLHQDISISVNKDGVKNFANPYSSYTIGYPEFIKAFGNSKALATPTGSASFKENKLDIRFQGSDPLVIPAPDIDWKAVLNFDKQNGYLAIKGKIYGKGFPAYELFIEDKNNKKVFLYTIPSPKRIDITTELSIDIYDWVFDVDIAIELSGNVFGDKVRLSSNLYDSIDNWNKRNMVKTPAPDCKLGECGN